LWGFESASLRRIRCEEAGLIVGHHPVALMVSSHMKIKPNRHYYIEVALRIYLGVFNLLTFGLIGAASNALLRLMILIRITLFTP
jgi:hypothetical protein